MRARKAIYAFGLLTVLFTLGACSSKHMAVTSETPKTVVTPLQNKATVVFMRPTAFATNQSIVYDITSGKTEFIGIISARTKFAHTSTPGKHRFMVIGESADFMDAELAPDKVYYTKITPRSGWWKHRFSLEPITKPSEENLATSKWVVNTPSSFKWAEEHMHEINQLKARYLPKWEGKAERPFLPSSAGQ